MSSSKNDSESTESHKKRDRSVSTQRSLMSFFAKKICSNEFQDRSRAENSEANNEENVSTTCDSNDNSALVLESNISADLQNVVDNNVRKNIFFDALYIGNFIDNQSSKLNDDKKYIVLTKTWRPDILYNFPKDKDSRKFQLKWLDNFPWLSYSQKHEGVYCRTCVLFSRDVGGRSKENLGYLCTKPLNKYNKALEVFKKNSNNDYHKFSILKADDFKNVVESAEKSVAVKFNLNVQKQIEENRKKLIPIVNTIFFCGRQNIPLRGHRDDGDFIQNSVNNEGNFRELLKFRMDSGDDILKNHLQNCPKNASFISKTIQNDLINCCASAILDKIVSAIKESKYFSILVVETSDISTKRKYKRKYKRTVSFVHSQCFS